MQTRFSVVGLILVTLLVSSCATPTDNAGGGSVTVNFEAPERFTDMGRSYPDQRGADEGYLEELRSHIERTVPGRLPAGATLSLTILDVDMAGQFEPERGPNFNDVRMVRSIYPPRIHVRYTLTDASGAVRAEGERRLTDHTFDWNISPIDRNDALKHEKRLIDDFVRDIASQAR
jgi:hypothetical protein